MTTTILQTGILIEHEGEGAINVISPFLDDEPIYNEVTLDTALKNQLKENLINLHHEL